MGYIILAKGRQSAFFWSELAWTCVYLGLAWTCIEAYGAEGAGIAFFGSYLFHCVLIYVLVTRMTGFTWSRWNRRAGLLTITLVGVVFGGFYVLPTWLATALGLGASALSGAYALRTLLKLVSAARIPAPLLGMLTRVGLVNQSSGGGLASEGKGR
jgi:PST family polysaccharide transporter